MTLNDDTRYLNLDGDVRLAYRQRSGRGPALLFCCGFHSDMNGNKATFLDQFAAERDLGYIRFDYQGHGGSSGRFADGTIGTWFNDALAIVDRVADGQQVVVGSSMGAWMALLLAKSRPERIKALVLLAPAPDFPTKLMLPSMPDEIRETLYRDGVWDRPSEYADEDYPITLTLIEESERHNVLEGDPVPFDGPVLIIHGDRDEVVPLDHVLKIPDQVKSTDIVTEIIKGGDHRLSTAADLQRLSNCLEGLLKLPD